MVDFLSGPRALARAARVAYRHSLLFRSTHPRRAHLYCIGTAKSGTHSVAALFGNSLRSAHEADHETMIETVLDLANGRMSPSDVRRYLARRDKRLWLEIDSSQINFFVVEDLVSLFPDSKFVLTIRDPYRWLDSLINHQLSRPVSRMWQQFRDYRFRAGDLAHPPGEAALRERGLYTLDGYLSYWARHNQCVLATVPAERLLIVDTDRISQEVGRIATFAGVPARAADRASSHAFKAKAKYGVLDEIDPDYLRARVQANCGPLLKTYYPERVGLEASVALP